MLTKYFQVYICILHLSFEHQTPMSQLPIDLSDWLLKADLTLDSKGFPCDLYLLIRLSSNDANNNVQ